MREFVVVNPALMVVAIFAFEDDARLYLRRMKDYSLGRYAAYRLSGARIGFSIDIRYAECVAETESI